MGNELLQNSQDSKTMHLNHGNEWTGWSWREKKWVGHKDPTGQPSLPIIISKKGREAKLFEHPIKISAYSWTYLASHSLRGLGRPAAALLILCRMWYGPRRTTKLIFQLGQSTFPTGQLTNWEEWRMLKGLVHVIKGVCVSVCVCVLVTAVGIRGIKTTTE